MYQGNGLFFFINLDVNVYLIAYHLSPSICRVKHLNTLFLVVLFCKHPLNLNKNRIAMNRERPTLLRPKKISNTLLISAKNPL